LSLGLGGKVTAQRVILKLALRSCLVRQYGTSLIGYAGCLRCVLAALSAAGDECLSGGDLLG